MTIVGRSGDKRGDGDRANGDRADEELEVLQSEDVEDGDEFVEPAEDQAVEIDEEDDSDGELLEPELEKEIEAVVELSSKEQSARSLEIRRAIEERMEKRQLEEDLDYLDMDFDD